MRRKPINKQLLFVAVQIEENQKHKERRVKNKNRTENRKKVHSKLFIENSTQA